MGNSSSYFSSYCYGTIAISLTTYTYTASGLFYSFLVFFFFFSILLKSSINPN